MRTIVLDEARPGDEVAEPVLNQRGLVILSKGAKLSPLLIIRLQRMGVEEVTIERDDPNAPPPKTLDEKLEELDERFEGLEENPLMMEIKHIAKTHLEEQEP